MPNYYRVGFDWDHVLKTAKGDVSKALRRWSDNLAASVKDLRALASLLDRTGFRFEGMECGQDCAVFTMLEGQAQRAVKAGLVQYEDLDESGEFKDMTDDEPPYPIDYSSMAPKRRRKKK